MHDKRRTSGLWIGLILLATPPAVGADRMIDIRELERTALAGSPVLEAARSRAAAAQAAAEAAGVRGDPELELWVRNALPELTDSADQPLAVEVEIVQPVRWPGKRGALRDVAAAEVAVAEAELMVVEQELLASLRRSFAELYAADREQRSLAEAHEILEVLQATANARFGAAQEGALAVLEAQLALDEHDQKVDRVFAGFLSERARLAALAGVPPESLPLLVGVLPEPAFAVAEGPVPIGAQAPKLLLAKLRSAVAERRLAAERLGLRPDFGVGGGFRWPDGENPELMFKLGVELPFLRRRRLEPRVRAQEAEVAAARSEAAAADLEGRAHV